jgi:hypothetical protein
MACGERSVHLLDAVRTARSRQMLVMRKALWSLTRIAAKAALFAEHRSARYRRGGQVWNVFPK